MELQKIIIHEIRKESGTNETQMILSDELTENDLNSSALVLALLNSYKTERKVLYAIFNDANGIYFPERFKNYQASARNDNDFIEFTRNAITNLNPIIKAKTLARGGYFLFVDYKNDNSDFLAIFLIRDTEGKILKRTDHSFSIQTIEYLDTNNLAMACKIDENRIRNNQPNYLSFTQLKQKDVAEYFLDWISIQQPESSIEYTNLLYDLLNIVDPPVDKESKAPYSIEEFRNNVYSYVTSNPNKIVNLHDLGIHFYNDPYKFIDAANDNDISIDTEFKYNKRQLRKFIRIEINKDGINMKFSRGVVYNNKIRLSEENRNIVIIESESFAKALRDEIGNTNND